MCKLLYLIDFHEVSLYLNVGITCNVPALFACGQQCECQVADHSRWWQVFVELDELHQGSDTELEWREKARWIKFEEDVEEGAERWGKPHVASLSFHSLLELRRGLEQGEFRRQWVQKMCRMGTDGVWLSFLSLCLSLSLSMMIIIIIIIIIAFKGTTGDLLQSLYCATNRLQHVHSSGLDAIMCKSRLIQWALIMWNMCCVPCGTQGQLSY